MNKEDSLLVWFISNNASKLLYYRCMLVLYLAVEDFLYIFFSKKALILKKYILAKYPKV